MYPNYKLFTQKYTINLQKIINLRDKIQYRL